ncbi:conserved hypothetical protein [Theileria equi strain WA]|uniref:Chorein N-terminal domain-containing protein n=1 Tax=Theileria equi strain WA TaxID=1537102 RepID=L1LDP5_THEEQ|nr:conserved hypothetical protein [Theileria equi strain WA]EKX73258.1 conserved hypothetical protein [Theileria equi strain WA]|eukprot:XP_004832710.1 conserved hypothetical protein [Theileria equi strain WA]
MFEGLVKRLLDTYLAPYVDGITQNLQLAVWSGNIILENLKLKDDISSKLALPFHAVSGTIGRMSIKIPWASLGSTPINIVVDSVHIVIDNRENDKTDEEILSNLRKNKSNMIALLEQEYFESANLKTPGKVNSSYFIRLSQKILNNIQIDFTNINVQLFDENSSFVFKIESIFLRKSQVEESNKPLKIETNDNIKEENITHVCSLLGFSIYEANGLNNNFTGNLDNDHNLNTQDESTFTLLEPLSFTLLLAVNPKNKSVYASLCIGSRNTTNIDVDPTEPLHIMLTQDCLRTFTKMWVDMQLETKRCKRILMQKADTVALDADSIKGTTKAEFIKLYTKSQNYLDKTGDGLLPHEEERLQTLIDVIPARYIARWKFACSNQKNAKTDTRKNGAKQESWFRWMRGVVTSVVDRQSKEKDGIDSESSSIENLPGGLVLTEEEVNMIKETMSLDDRFEDSLATSSYYFECMLPRFQFTIDASRNKVDSRDILLLDMENLQFRLFFHSVVDVNDKDTYEGYFDINLDSFDVIFRETKLMAFISNNTPSSPANETCRELESCRDDHMSNEKSSMSLRVSHEMTNKGNILVINGELKPLETNLIPSVIPVLFEFFSYFQPPQVIHATTREHSAISDHLSNVSANIDAVIEDEILSVEKPLYNAAQHLPSLLSFDVKFSAPILLLYSGTYDRIDIHFGTLILKSNGPCLLSNINGTIELKETQISCRHHLHNEGERFDFLRPLPMKIHFDWNSNIETLSLDVLFEEVFVQVTPLATATLFEIPNELIQTIIQAKETVRIENNKRVEINSRANTSFSDSLWNYRIHANILIQHSGFSVSNMDLCEVFKLEMYNSSFKLETAPTKSSVLLGLEHIMISNPSVDMPLFFTNTEFLPSGRKDGNVSDDDSEFVDALEENIKSLEIEIITDFSSGIGSKTINLSLIEMEGNWQYKSINVMVEAFQEYKNIITGGIKNSMHKLKGGIDQKSFSFLPDSAVAAVTGTLQTFKQRLGITGASADNSNNESWNAGVGITDVHLGTELPPLYSEKMNMPADTHVNISIKGAAIVFWTKKNEPIARLSTSGINYRISKFDNESIVKVEVGTGKLMFGGRCILSHTVNPEQQAEHPLLKFVLKCYNSTRLQVPYSMCLNGGFERIIFVYFQQDINRLMNYLDDGILSVFISKSYHKVVETAASTYMLFNFSVTSPCFIIPENKAILSANLKTMESVDYQSVNQEDQFMYDDSTIPPGPMLPNIIDMVNKPKNKHIPINSEFHDAYDLLNKIFDKVDTWYFGSYLLLELGHLQFNNGYTHRSDESLKSTMFLKMFGTRALIVEQDNGTDSVTGKILDSTDLAVCTRGGEMLEIGIDSDDWVLKLSRKQLTFLIDVFSENICGVRSKPTSNAPDTQPTKTESRYCIRITLKRFQFNSLAYNSMPLADFQFDHITVCLDYASNSVNMTSCFQFGFCSKNLIIDDKRINSINTHRRLLDCSVKGEPALKVGKPANVLEPSVDGLLYSWLKQYRQNTGHDFFSNVSSDLYSIKCVVNSETLQNTIDCTISNAAISLLFVFFMDIVRYFSLSYGKSSLSRFPKKESITVNPQSSSNEKVYTLNLIVNNGKFIAFSKMNSEIYPQLELSSDFMLVMTVTGSLYKFVKLDILDCELSRVYPLEDRRQILCRNLEAFGNGQYVSDVLTSKMFFEFTMPPAALTLYTRDLSILIAATTSMFTDGPSVMPVKLINNQIIEDTGASGKFLSLSFKVKGIKVTFFDDMRKALVPMMKMNLSSEKIEYLNLPIEKRYNIIRCSCKLDYFNAAIGDWEPCLEKFNFDFEFTKNVMNDKSLKSKRITRMGTEDVWKEFVPKNLVRISSMYSILINITPSLCQLLLWFIPMLSDNLNKGLVYINPLLISKSSSNSLSDDSNNGIDNSAYRYINLTGYEYYGFTLDTNCSNQNEAYSELKVVTTTTKPMELDSLVNKEKKESNPSDLCIYLTARPPESHVNILSRKLGIKNKQVIIRDLMVTRSIGRTKENLRHSNPNTVPSIYNSPFENGTSASKIPLARNCCVPLAPPLMDALSYTSGENDEYPEKILEQAMENKSALSIHNVLCEVKTPHPSHKLLVFTSTVRIFNRSGLPLLFCFLDLDLRPIFMSNLRSRSAPISLLDKPVSSNEFLESTTIKFSNDNSFASDKQKDFGYAIYLENNHFLSVPEWAFIGASHVIFSFTPAPLVSGKSDAFHSKGTVPDLGSKESWSKLVNKSGWSKITDTLHHSGTRVRQCYCSNMSKSNFIYFVVSVNSKKSLLPANCDTFEITIYPSLSVMNTLPVELDLRFTAKDHNFQDNRTSLSPLSRHLEKSENNRYIQETLTLKRKSIMHIYSVPPNESLSFVARITNLQGDLGSDKAYRIENQYSRIGSLQLDRSGNLWSDRISKIYGTSETQTKFFVPMPNTAPLELEMIRYPGGLPVTSNSFHGHLSLIINTPWLFIDRTGLGIQPHKKHFRPTLNGLSFLSSDDEEQTIYLSTGGKINDQKLSQAGIRLPAVGGYSYATVEDGSRQHAISLITEKVHISGLSSHVSCRITSAMPEYLVTNNLKQNIFIRKDARTQPIEVEKGTTIAIPWHSQTISSESSSSVSLEFKPSGDSNWSSPIHPSEIFAGQTYIALRTEKRSRPLVFCISIVPKYGTKYCIISPPESNKKGYVLTNYCTNLKAAMVRTFHKSTISSTSSENPGNSSGLSSSVCFTAKYGQTVHFGWSQPYLHKSRLCQVLLWLDKTVVFPEKPLVINIGSPALRYKQAEIPIPGNPHAHIYVSAENRGDCVTIEIKPTEKIEKRVISAEYNEDSKSSLDSTFYSESQDNDSEYVTCRGPKGEEYKTCRESDSLGDRYLDFKQVPEINSEDIKDVDDAYIGEINLVSKNLSLQIALQLSQIGLSVVSQILHEELFFMEVSNLVSVALCKDDHQRLEVRIDDIQIDNQTDFENGDITRTILVNRGKVAKHDQPRPFLQIYIDRPFASCKDLCLKKVFVSLDDIEVDVSDTLFSRVYNLYKECMKSMDTVFRSKKVDFKMIDDWIEQESRCRLSSIEANPESPCAISLDYLYIESFNLIVWCSFELEKLHMLGDLMRMGLRILSVSRHFELMGAPLQFQREYISISRSTLRSFYEHMKDRYLHSALSCIGSILGYSSLLNIPKLPITVGKCTIELAADAVDSVSTGIGGLLSKFTFDAEYINKRQRDRISRPCSNVKEGIFSAGKSIGEGFLSLTNIVTKPIEGAQKEGMGGFIKGLGKGLAGSIVKPIDKVGQAVSQVSRGIKANMSKSLLFDRCAIEPCRKPRMLWGEFSQVKPYSLGEAEIKSALGHKLSKKIMHCQTVLKQSQPPTHLALLFYPSKTHFVDLCRSRVSNKPTVIWKLHISDINECRASSHGVIIRCKGSQYQIPCSNAEMINSIFISFENARKQASSLVTIGPDLFNDEYN